MTLWHWKYRCISLHSNVSLLTFFSMVETKWLKISQSRGHIIFHSNVSNNFAKWVWTFWSNRKLYWQIINVCGRTLIYLFAYANSLRRQKQWNKWWKTTFFNEILISNCIVEFFLHFNRMINSSSIILIRW